MSTLVSRKVESDLTLISKVSLDPGDVLVVRPPLSQLTQQQRMMYTEALKNALVGVFPNNKVVVMDKAIDINIVTIT